MTWYSQYSSLGLCMTWCTQSSSLGLVLAEAVYFWLCMTWFSVASICRTLCSLWRLCSESGKKTLLRRLKSSGLGILLPSPPGNQGNTSSRSSPAGTLPTRQDTADLYLNQPSSTLRREVQEKSSISSALRCRVRLRLNTCLGLCSTLGKLASQRVGARQGRTRTGGSTTTLSMHLSLSHLLKHWHRQASTP